MYINELILKFIWRDKRLIIANIILKLKEKVEGCHSSPSVALVKK